MREFKHLEGAFLTLAEVRFECRRSFAACTLQEEENGQISFGQKVFFLSNSEESHFSSGEKLTGRKWVAFFLGTGRPISPAPCSDL